MRLSKKTTSVSDNKDRGETNAGCRNDSSVARKPPNGADFSTAQKTENDDASFPKNVPSVKKAFVGPRRMKERMNGHRSVEVNGDSFLDKKSRVSAPNVFSSATSQVASRVTEVRSVDASRSSSPLPDERRVDVGEAADPESASDSASDFGCARTSFTFPFVKSSFSSDRLAETDSSTFSQHRDAPSTRAAAPASGQVTKLTVFKSFLRSHDVGAHGDLVFVRRPPNSASLSRGRMKKNEMRLFHIHATDPGWKVRKRK